MRCQRDQMLHRFWQLIKLGITKSQKLSYLFKKLKAKFDKLKIISSFRELFFLTKNCILLSFTKCHCHLLYSVLSQSHNCSTVHTNVYLYKTACSVLIASLPSLQQYCEQLVEAMSQACKSLRPFYDFEALRYI